MRATTKPHTCTRESTRSKHIQDLTVSLAITERERQIAGTISTYIAASRTLTNGRNVAKLHDQRRVRVMCGFASRYIVILECIIELIISLASAVKCSKGRMHFGYIK